MASVAFLRLNAADGEHGLAGNSNQVRAQAHRNHRFAGKAEFAGADERDLGVEVGFDKFPVDPSHAQPERQRDMV